MRKTKVAIIGSGNIGTDLMIKVMRHGGALEMGMLVGIDPESEGLAREKLGGAQRGKAIIVMNPAEPPVLMRDTIYCFSRGGEPEKIERAIENMVARVAAYVPGYRLKQKVQFERVGDNRPLRIPGIGDVAGLKTSVFLEIEGAAHYLPSYA